MTDSSKNLKFSTLVNLLRFRALNQANQIAFIFLMDGETESSSLTYQELDRQARAIATQLQSVTIPGARALLLYPSGLEFIAAFFGCLYASVVAVPAYLPKRNRRMSRLQAILDNAQASVILTNKELLPNIESGFSKNTELSGLSLLTTNNIAGEQMTYSWQEPAVSSETLAFIQYTSGSTGAPKGVMVTHKNVLHNEHLIQKHFKHNSKTIGVGWLPLFHDMGLIGNVLQSLYLGIPSILMPPEAFIMKPFRWLKAISNYKATTSGGPNFAYDLCVNKITPEQRESLDLSSWKVAFNGAEPIRPQTLEQFASTFADCGFHREALYPCYGMAETTLLVAGGLKAETPVIRSIQRTAIQQNRVVENTNEREKVRKIVSCGFAWLDQKIKIVDPKRLTLCSANQVGEIWISSFSVAQGYWNRTEETEKTFHAYLTDTGEGPFLRTGDLGFLQGGELFITGRLKDLIIIRGTNYYPQDIELTVEQSHPGLRSSCGAAFTVEVNDVERLVITQEVERSNLRQLKVDEIAGAIRQEVSINHDLQVYAVLLLKTASIPKTSSGKIQRHACRSGFLDGSLNVVGKWTAKPHSAQQQSKEVVTTNNTYLYNSITEEEIQAWLISHLALELKVPPNEIDIQESFAYYGMDSAIAVDTVGQLIDWLECELEPTLFWEYPNIESLARHLAKKCSLLPTNSQVRN
jgi:acyl-CoA synthetase (AMP-forming)/AMP-acid ligase II/acyl carrier protein